jgi:hypothetical protein
VVKGKVATWALVLNVELAPGYTARLAGGIAGAAIAFGREEGRLKAGERRAAGRRALEADRPPGPAGPGRAHVVRRMR